MNSLRMSFWIVPASFSGGTPCSSRGDDVTGEHRQHRAVHRHRHRHLVERDAVEEDLHVLDRVDRNSGLADVADDARMVAVVAAVGREVERDREPHLTGREILGGRTRSIPPQWKSPVLPDRPRPVRVHRRPRSAQIRREPRHHAGQPHTRVLDPLQVRGGIERLDGDALRGRPIEFSTVLPLSSLRVSRAQSFSDFAGNGPSSAIVFSRAG